MEFHEPSHVCCFGVRTGYPFQERRNERKAVSIPLSQKTKHRGKNERKAVSIASSRKTKWKEGRQHSPFWRKDDLPSRVITRRHVTPPSDKNIMKGRPVASPFHEKKNIRRPAALPFQESQPELRASGLPFEKKTKHKEAVRIPCSRNDKTEGIAVARDRQG